MLWSDESIFRVTDNARGNVYRRPGSDRLDPKFCYHTVKHPESLMASGCFTFFNIAVLKSAVLRCHTAKSVTQWLSDSEVNFISDWPSNSPNLSLIENLWSIIKHRLQGKDTSTLTKLETVIKEEWLNFDHTILENLANSLPSRLKECIRRKGKPIDY
ncbi:Transposable element Tcb1 transposase [Portunus trituberculatus]|uniref:Transposable element Tcb1 transposase n=1 Tax=Portunus trituberculatus TaxID=210409 RepID=A0A5B7JY69_PORTR|nr:Transposable element Tcb1 transposase [Portunus trituberculatus]